MKLSRDSTINIAVAATIRLLLMGSKYQGMISDRVEVSTSLNSWKRVTEGVYLLNSNVDPYSGDTFHVTPIYLMVFSLMLEFLSTWYLRILFVLTDVVTALLLSTVSEHYLKELVVKEDKITKERKNVKESDDSNACTRVSLTSSTYVFVTYLFNPYIILNCVGQTTTVFTNFLCALALFGMVKRSSLLSCLSISLLTHQSVYHVSLMVPTVIYIARNSKPSARTRTIAGTVATFVLFLGSLFAGSYYVLQSWSFLDSTVGFILSVPDLRPNIGLYWYFFTEMFEHFRLLFITLFQLNVSFLYIVPLALRLRHDPMLLAFSYLTITAIFKSYPCIGDVGLYMSLLPLWKHLFQHMQQGFIVGCFILFCTVCAPTVWHQWIYSRSANANFYFGVTLAFAIAQVFLLTDILFAHVKREFAVKHGISSESSENKLLLE